MLMARNPGASSPAELDRRIFEEQVSLLARQYAVPALAGSFVSLVVFWALQKHIPESYLFFWLITQNVFLGAGHLVVKLKNSNYFQKRPVEHWLRVYLVALSLVGLGWGIMTMFLFIDFPILNQIVVFMVTVGAAASSIALAIPLLRAYYAFLSFSFLPLILWLLTRYPNTIFLLGLLGMMFYFLLVFAGRNLNGQIVKTIRLRFENAELADEVNQLNANLEKRVMQKTQELYKSEERFHLAMQGANDGLWDWDIENGKAYFSPRWKGMLGYTESEIGNSPKEWRKRIHREDRRKVLKQLQKHLQGSIPNYESVHRVMDKHGQYIWVLDRGRVVFSDLGVPHRMVGTQVDITDQKQLEEKYRSANLKLKHEAKERILAQQELAHLAKHDPLTNLPNRLLFFEQLQEAIRRAEIEDDTIAVLMVDLDNFKHINDTMGHPVGDRLLVDVSRRLTSIVNKHYFLSRFGGDEFLVILEGCADTFIVDAYAKEIIELLAKPFYLDNQDVRIGCSIGIALFPEHGKEPDKLIRDADIAMYHAKEAGRNGYRYFSSEMDQEMSEKVALKNLLHGALDRGEFEVYYQPQVSIRTGRVIGLEALLRWNPENRESVAPDRFIPLLEEAGLISQVGRWLIREACEKTLRLQKHGFTDLRIAVNVSPNQFYDGNLAQDIEKITAEVGFDPRLLEIEITENIFLEDLEVIHEALTGLNEIGIHVTLDDFGTGYASLGYLKRFPINGVKIDKVFILDLLQNDDSRELVGAIVALSNGLKMGKLIAEGVENEAQLNLLREIGCPSYQGYLFSKPVPYASLESMLIPAKRRLKEVK